jgi:type II secretory pathway pseudopilin PulG
MTVPIRVRHGRRRRDDRGSVLVSVLGSMIVISAFLLASLGFALQQAPAARRDQDAKSAIASAEAGIEEYLSRLNADTNYWKQGNGDTSNPAFGAGQVIDGTSGQGGSFRYQVLSTPAQTSSSGVLRLRVTGTSAPAGNGTTVSKSLTVLLRPKAFLDFVYFSDIEVLDPAIVGSNPLCAKHYYDSPPRSGRSDCAEVYWGTGDVVDGPFHSNDAVQINGRPTFTNPRTESSWPAIQGAGPTDRTWWTQIGTNPPLPQYAPRYAPPMALPVGNAALLKQVAPDVDGDGSVGPGCYYTGQTRIIFAGTSMKVLSPSTTSPSTPSRCYDVNHPNLEQTITPIPPLVYVDGTTSSCTFDAIGYPRPGEQYTVGSATAIAWQTDPSRGGYSPNYDCSRGSAFVEGNADGQVTVAARDDVVITNDLTATDGTTGSDIVGLIAGNYVWVYHPVNNGMQNITDPVPHTIDAAVLALRHSYILQNWDQGNPLGSISFRGSVAQEFSGPFATAYPGGTIRNGYPDQSMTYDPRLAYMQPPFFLQPDSSPWAVATVTDG